VLDGCERADSLLVNPHKWLLTPMDCSVLYTSRPDDLRAAFSVIPEYLRTDDRDAVNLMDYGVALGRRFRSLKLWMVLRAYGADGLAAIIAGHVELAQRLEAAIELAERLRPDLVIMDVRMPELDGIEALARLKPTFHVHGTVTAGNSCPLNDGAAAVVIMSDLKAKELGIKPLARIVSTGVSALEPEFMGLGPIDSSRQALKRAGMSIDDVDLVEINEAFAAQVIPSARALGIDPFGDKLNQHGGAIALGHPFGMTGARILCTLLNGLQTKGKTIGLETMCVGGGQGMAMIFERLN
jgi:CheY-like chemotaxis protein